MICNGLGKVGNSVPRSSSPLIDVEGVSDDESDTRNSVVGQFNVSKNLNPLCCLSVFVFTVVLAVFWYEPTMY